MKTTIHARFLGLLLAALVGLSLTACSTTASRIKANPEIFAKLTPEQQAMVKGGHVGLGFSMDAVKLALGDPDRVTTRTATDGDSIIWHYLSYEADGRLLFTGYYHTGRGWWGGAAYPYYLDYPNRQVRDRFRVMFKGDRVSAITREVDGE